MTGMPRYDYIEAMKLLSLKNVPVMALLLSGALLCGAWIFQYGFGYDPCQMCYWQRHAHKGVLAVAAAALLLTFAGKNYPKFFAFLIGLAFLVSFGMAFWHVGVEYQWWEGPKNCMVGALDPDFDPSKIWDEVDKIKLPACTAVAWKFVLSMAGWNALFSAFGAIFSFAAIKRAPNV